MSRFVTSTLVSVGLALWALPVAAQALVPLGPEFVINTTTTGGQYQPDVAANAAGEFVVVWMGPDADGSGIFGQRLDAAGVPLGGEFAVSQSTTGDQAHPRVSRTKAGIFTVVWESAAGDGSDSGIFARIFGNAGAGTNEFQVNTHTTDFQRAPAIGNDGLGTFVVAWGSFAQVSAPSEFDTFAQRFTGHQDFLGAEFRVNTYITGKQSPSDVVFDSQGGFLVVFGGPAPGDVAFEGSAVSARRYDPDGSAVGADFRVNTYVTGAQSAGHAAFSSSGDFLVTWRNQQEISAALFDAGGAPLVPEYRVNSITTGSQAASGLVSDGGDRFVVLFASDPQTPGTNGDYDVHARVTTNAGDFVGDQFRVNTYMTSAQRNASIARGAGRYLVVWESLLQSSAGSASDVYGRFLALSGDVNLSGQVDIADVFYLINFLFASGPPPLGPADPNGVGGTDIADVFYLINFLFASGPPPV
jgi:hypothetical protein